MKALNKINQATTKFYCNNEAAIKASGVGAAVLAAATPMLAMAAGGLEGTLQGMGTVVIIALAIVFIIFVAKGAIATLRGGDLKKEVILPAVIILFLIGLVVVGMNAENLKNMFGGVANKATSIASDTADKALG